MAKIEFNEVGIVDAVDTGRIKWNNNFKLVADVLNGILSIVNVDSNSLLNLTKITLVSSNKSKSIQNIILDGEESKLTIDKVEIINKLNANSININGESNSDNFVVSGNARIEGKISSAEMNISGVVINNNCEPILVHKATYPATVYSTNGSFIVNTADKNNIILNFGAYSQTSSDRHLNLNSIVLSEPKSENLGQIINVMFIGIPANCEFILTPDNIVSFDTLSGIVITKNYSSVQLIATIDYSGSINSGTYVWALLNNNGNTLK